MAPSQTAEILGLLEGDVAGGVLDDHGRVLVRDQPVGVGLLHLLQRLGRTGEVVVERPNQRLRPLGNLSCVCRGHDGLRLLQRHVPPVVARSSTTAPIGPPASDG